MKKILALAAVLSMSSESFAQTKPAPADVKPGSISCEECPYPYPSSYLPLTVYGQDVRMAFMDVAPAARRDHHEEHEVTRSSRSIF